MRKLEFIKTVTPVSGGAAARLPKVKKCRQFTPLEISTLTSVSGAPLLDCQKFMVVVKFASLTFQKLTTVFGRRCSIVKSAGLASRLPP